MSIVDENGQPVAYGWNDIAAAERWEQDPRLTLMSDEEFARRFPEIAGGVAVGKRRETNPRQFSSSGG